MLFDITILPAAAVAPAAASVGVYMYVLIVVCMFVVIVDDVVDIHGYLVDST